MARWSMAALALMAWKTAFSAASSFEWRWDDWQISVVNDQVQVLYRQALVFRLTPPLTMRFRDGEGRRGVVTLRWQGGEGEGVWTLGVNRHQITVLAQHTLSQPSLLTWRWLTVNGHLLQGAKSSPVGGEWKGLTVFGAMHLSVGGDGAQTRWQPSDNDWNAALIYPFPTTKSVAQLEGELPPHWLKAEPPKGEPSVHPMDLVQGEFWDLPLVPRPKWWRWGDAPFRLGRQVPLFVAQGYERAAERLCHFLQERWLRQVTVRLWTPNTSLERGIVIASHHSPLREEAAKLEPLLRHELPNEGYALAATPQGAWILAADAKGAFWGAQTLRQLLRLTNEGALIVPGVFIRDYPDFPFRGVHFVADDHSPEFHTRLTTEVLASLKFNRLIVQLDHLKWERHPELWQPWSLPKDGAKRLQQIAEANEMEVIPLLPTLSHCEYLFGALGSGKPKVNADISEDPEVAYAYCPNSERTYRLVFDLLDEVLTLFNPRWVHLGHDEVTNRGRFGQCMRCQGTPPHQLFAYDVRRLYDFLKERGIRTMLWGDMLLRPDEASDATHGGEPFNFWLSRRLLPRDIVIMDWHYQPAPYYPSVHLFKREGFTVIGATWRNLQNIADFAKAAHKAGAWGMVQTTWTGFGNNRNALRDFPDQFTALVTAADRFWNADTSSPSFSDWNVFETLWRDSLVRPMAGFILDLTEAANVPLANLVGVSEGALWGSRRWWNRRLFWLPTDEQGNLKALALRSVWLNQAPKEVVLPINESAMELTFVHATGFPVPDETVVGGYEIWLADGERLTVPLRYGQNLRALTDDRPLRDLRASIAWRWMTPKGTIALNALTVPLPSEKEVNSVRFYAAHDEATPLLAALTGISSKGVAEGAP